MANLTSRFQARSRALLASLIVIAASFVPWKTSAAQTPPAPLSLVLSEHPAGQAPDVFQGRGSISAAVLYRFRMTPSDAQQAVVSHLDVLFSEAKEFVSTDFKNVFLVEDANDNGQADASETVRLPGIVRMREADQQIHCQGAISLSSAKSYVLIADLAFAPPGGAFTLSLISDNVDARDGSGVPILVNGSVSSASHEEEVSLGVYYVSAPNGSDTYSGSAASPWKTIQKAASTIPAGSTVIILPGTYAGGIVWQTPAVPNARTVFKGDQRTGEVIIDTGLGSPGFTVAKASNGSVTLADFKVTGTGSLGIISDEAPSVFIERVALQGITGDGIRLINASGSKVLHSESRSNRVGLKITASDAVVVSDFLAAGNSNEGVYVTTTSNVVIRNVTAHGNQHGFHCAPSGNP